MKRFGSASGRNFRKKGYSMVAQKTFKLHRLIGDAKMKRICEGCGRVNDAPHAGVVCCSGYRNWEIPLTRMTYAPQKAVEQNGHIAQQTNGADGPAAHA